ncbi:MAG: M48 family metalloprotease [Burkholderiales bacterium]|nr:MAG: M48 family metalloprotease [Burkholderiales bacterium]
MGIRARRALATLVVASVGIVAPVPAQVSITDLPALGDPSRDELTPSAERRLGETIMRELRRERALLADPDLADYLNGFTSTLTATAIASGYTFEFFLVPERTLNAFALPGGFIGVHTGLIVAAQSESELASVLAHEIGHVTQRHIARMLAQQRQSSLVALAAALLAALAARSGPDAAMGVLSLGETLAAQQLMSFSRNAEREADRIGIEMLREAQFDLNGMVAFFGRLQQASRVYESEAPAYLRTHPLTTERMADMQARILGLPYRQRADSLEFMLVRARLRALQDPSIDGLRSARTYFDRVHRERVLAAPVALYGEAVAAVALREFEDARALIEAARAALVGPARSDPAIAAVLAASRLAPSGPSHPFLERLDAERALLDGDGAQAAAIAAAARERYRDARGLAQIHARALLATGRHEQAVVLLADLTRRHPHDIELWRLASEAYDAGGRRALAHRSAAEAFALVGAWPAAIEQLRLAQRAADADFATASVIDARRRELEEELRRERAERGARPER